MISIIDLTESPDGAIVCVQVPGNPEYPVVVAENKEIVLGFTRQDKPAIFEKTEFIDQYGLAVDGKYQVMVACY